jgi:hypothetical protein
MLQVCFEYLTGLKTQVITRARLTGNWWDEQALVVFQRLE